MITPTRSIITYRGPGQGKAWVRETYLEGFTDKRENSGSSSGSWSERRSITVSLSYSRWQIYDYVMGLRKEPTTFDTMLEESEAIPESHCLFDVSDCARADFPDIAKQIEDKATVNDFGDEIKVLERQVLGRLPCTYLFSADGRLLFYYSIFKGDEDDFFAPNSTSILCHDYIYDKEGMLVGIYRSGYNRSRGVFLTGGLNGRSFSENGKKISLRWDDGIKYPFLDEFGQEIIMGDRQYREITHWQSYPKKEGDFEGVLTPYSIYWAMRENKWKTPFPVEALMPGRDRVFLNSRGFNREQSLR
ncbi:MAG: hypothetical protein HQ564_05935 [Candidatus Saganbacteria bacterium]|nr:hypothetical protein [Candidatus Saganbacteria bacterium]